jgi:hypothetical protein
MNTNNNWPSELHLAALEVAKEQVGVQEVPKGSNKGPMINEYLKAVGLGPGYAWCQAFVYWCYAVAAKTIGVENLVVRTAGVYDCWNRSTKRNGVVKIAKSEVVAGKAVLQPGDQFVMMYGKGAGHTGIIENVTENEAGATVLHTIEGNSNNSGSREGYAVVRQTRLLSEKALQGFLRYS